MVSNCFCIMKHDSWHEAELSRSMKWHVIGRWMHMWQLWHDAPNSQSAHFILCCTHPVVSPSMGVSRLSPLVIHWLPCHVSAPSHHPLPGLPGVPGVPEVVRPHVPAVLPPLRHLPVPELCRLWRPVPGLKQMVLVSWPAPALTRHAPSVHVERGPVWPAAAPALAASLSLLTWAWGAVNTQKLTLASQFVTSPVMMLKNSSSLTISEIGTNFPWFWWHWNNFLFPMVPFVVPSICGSSWKLLRLSDKISYSFCISWIRTNIMLPYCTTVQLFWKTGWEADKTRNIGI